MMVRSMILPLWLYNLFLFVEASAAKQPKKGRSADKAPASASKTASRAGKKAKAT